ncbi:MAG: alpha-mannosidase, partial [Clostridia bacterium]|nr:alpha-mannosidase [Clostridia bacterium]
NDCKYGWTIKEGSIKPTLLRSATEPNYYQDRERHEFTYAIYPHSGAVNTSDVVYEGYNLNVPMYCKAVGAQNGNLPAEYSLVSVNAGNVIIETVKKAEDSDAIIVRAYETWNKKTACEFSFGSGIASVSECNLLEEKDAELAFCDNKFATEFRPFEIKTFKVILK